MSPPTFRALDDVVYGRVDRVSPLIRRVIAENPSKFTYRGTGTYVIGHGDVVVIDPGPLLDSHRDALAAALRGERVRAILITHCHSDHSPLSAWLAAATGASTFAFGPHPPVDGAIADDIAAGMRALFPDEPNAPERVGEPVEMEESTDTSFVPDHAVSDGDVVVADWGLTISAVHTPGHTSNHTCWALAQERALFTGDHVMGWSTTVVSPPDGVMSDYIESLRRVARRADDVLWPTHGPPRDDARDYVAALVEHRLQRERGVLAQVRAGNDSIRSIVETLYADVRVELHKAAAMSVWGHLVKLAGEGLVTADDGSRPSLASRYRAA